MNKDDSPSPPEPPREPLVLERQNGTVELRMGQARLVLGRGDALWLQIAALPAALAADEIRLERA